MLTWRTADRFVYEVATRTEEELFKYVGNPLDFVKQNVGNPLEFVKQRKNTSIVVADAAALWLKLRGEEKVLLSTLEQSTAARRRALAKQIKNTVTAQEKAKFAEEAQQFLYETRGASAQVRAMYSSSVDKY